MKLSEKGLYRLHNEAVRIIENGTICHQPIGHDQMEALHDFEFRPDDFQGAVVLTVEEAKTIEHCFSIFQKHFKIFEPEMKVWQELRKRIEQAEKENEAK